MNADPELQVPFPAQRLETLESVPSYTYLCGIVKSRK